MSLSSSPVEIILESLMVILVSKPKHEWEIIDQIGKNIKKEIINEFAEALLDTLRKGEPENEEENKGFVERLTMKILDNLQIKIRNIHIRYEVSAETNISDHTGFALGIKLEQLNIVTTDDNWVVRFIDRTQEENKGKPMLKLLELNQLSFYSDSSEK